VTRRRRVGLALVAAAAALHAPRAATADESLARRLAALRFLVEPEASRRAAASIPAESACSRGAWWRVTDYAERTRIETAIRDASLRFRTDPDLIRSVIRHESAGNVDAVSHKGAMGLMQLMPGTASSLGVVCAFDPRENVLGGTRYLRRMYERLGSWPRAVAAYHAGPGAVEGRRLGPETRRYVARVLRAWKPEHYATIRLD